MRVLLWTYDTRGGIEPLIGLAVQLQALGAEVRVCAPPDEQLAERIAGYGVPMVPFRDSLRAAASATTPDLHQYVNELIGEQFETVAAAAEGCDALLATGFMPIAAGARSATEKLGIHYQYATYSPTNLPSPHHPPETSAGAPVPPGLIDNQMLWDIHGQNANAIFGPMLNGHRASIGLPPVFSVRRHALTDHPWLAADPILGPWQKPADLDVVQTGAWLLRDDRPLPPELLAFLDAGPPPVYVGFGSMAMGGSKDIAGVAIEAIRAQGHRTLLARGWADLALIDERDDCFAVGEVNQQALFGRVAAVVHHGGSGTTRTAALAGAPQVVIPQVGDQPYWAGRVAELGIGTAHIGPTVTTESLSAALKTALAPETRARSSAVAGTIRTDGATVAATLLIETISQKRPSASA
ncbi:glycosyltransferase [Mycobacterium numidiamassiliense]|uniref:glycosyltransferase n=1 Tax=Mycobacterium numidiamassiliense TaxID=1841861 RepID=UPI00097E0D2C|nr:glycosyltransferase [Mycobacterium numidiamassiliense]